MLKNFFKVIFRYFLRSRFFTLLNVAGLSIGTACCIIIYLFVQHELSYDKFHSSGDAIYRVIRRSQINGMPYNIGVTSAPYAPTLMQDFGDRIQDATRAMSFSALLKHEDKSFIEEKLLLADENFLRFFTYPLAKGDARTALKGAGSFVITKAMAKKYFGEEDPIGKPMRLDDQYDVVVTGVLDDLPGNTHLQFDAIGAIALAQQEDWFNDWWSNSLNTYVNVPNTQDAAFLNAGFPAFMEKYFGKDFERVGNKIGLTLEPLSDIYFNYGTRYEDNIVHGDKRYVYIFSSIGVLLILLASINYVNLATAQASKRAKEVGIRKTLGSAKRAIAGQFLTESFTLCLISIVISAGLAQLIIPFFNSAFHTAISGVLGNSSLWLFLIGFLFFVSILSGSYPAFLLSSFTPIHVLKGAVKTGTQYLLVRKTLVVFQFSISVFMIIATLFIDRQLSYMHEKDLGFATDNVAVVRLNNGSILRNAQSFKNSLLQQPGISHVAVASSNPGGFYDATTVAIEGETENLRMRTLWTDENLPGALDLTVVHGRYFSPDVKHDGARSVLLNETAIRQLGWAPEEAIGKRVMLAQFDSTYKEIIGVVKDYHFTSLKQKIEPLIISYDSGGRNMIIRFSEKDLHAQTENIQKLWDSYSTGFPLDMVFLDDVVNRLYTAEIIQGRLFKILSLISVAIACLGIIGLASYITVQRKKEIGIRKVLGASSQQVSVILMKDLLTLVAVAIIVAVPVCYWAILQWSSDFAYSAPMSPLIFITGSAIVFGITAVIVGLNATKAAVENPVDALRNE